jgi:5-methylcytosine-specific restriction endonuclease McrA
MAKKRDLLEKLTEAQLKKLAKKYDLLDDARADPLNFWSHTWALKDHLEKSRKVTIAEIETLLNPKKGKGDSKREPSVKGTEREKSTQEIRRTLTEAQKRKLERIAGFKCELCGKFLGEITPDTHHITPHAMGGSDKFNNLIVLCPNCHRRVHEGKVTQSELRRAIAKRK